MFPRPKPQAPEGDAQQGDASGGAVAGVAGGTSTEPNAGTATDAKTTTEAQAKPGDGEGAKAGEPPAQAGDETVETRVAVAKPVLQTIEAAKQELADNPARTSAQSRDGVVVREG